MKYYKTETGEVFAYDGDGSQDKFIRPDLVAMTDAEIDAHVNPHLTPEDSARIRILSNNSAYEAATKALIADYPQLEKETWPTQNEQASAWVADPDNAATPWIDRAAVERGIDREEYLRRTLVKAEQFKIISAFLTGRRQRYEDQIKAGNDPVLDYALTAEVQSALYQISQSVMSTAAADLQGALA